MATNGNGNGYNGKYTAQQFIDAIPGTGGIVSAIADNVGCAWNTAKKYIDEYSTVNQAWQNERNRIKDQARHNVITSIEKGDLQTSKWFLTLTDREFQPIRKQEISGPDGGPIELTWPDGSSVTEPA